MTQGRGDWHEALDYFSESEQARKQLGDDQNKVNTITAKLREEENENFVTLMTKWE